jgi:enamine deaminase RidA (YjgF/YER057c/UK114 family)
VTLDVHYLGAGAVPAQPLLVAGFGGAPRPSALDPACPFVPVALDLVAGEPYEVWTTADPVRYGSEHGFVTAATDTLLFAGIDIDEDGDLESATRRAYDALFALLDRTGYPHLLRVWNHFAGITDQVDGMERYRRFTIGRYAAFEARRRAVEAAPAACAVGTFSGPLSLYLLASRTPGTTIENPRQVSAYRYPDRYGPKSPTFSRAMLGSADEVLFISGTASIVGHESRHLGDPLAQANETLANIDQLLAQAGRQNGNRGALRLKTYLRDPQLLGTVRELIETRLREDDSVVYVAGEICRPELLLEIEGICLKPGAA